MALQNYHYLQGLYLFYDKKCYSAALRRLKVGKVTPI